METANALQAESIGTFTHVPPELKRFYLVVGTAIAGRPLHRSVRKELPHTAPPLSDDGHDEFIAKCGA